jgi:tight adherence protein C
MSVALAVALGSVFGFAVTGVWTALRPVRPSLADAVARLEGSDSTAGATAAPALARVTARLGLPSESLRADLAVVGRTEADYLRQLTTAVATAVALPAVLAALLGLLGSTPSLPLVLAVSLGLGIFAPALVNAHVRSKAADQRREYLRALAIYLQLCAMSLTGGAGVEAALHHSANAGHGKEFDAIRTTLERAAALRQTPWEALSALGARIDVPAYQQLGATAGLAGSEGARVRRSLSDRSRALRTARLADDEAARNSSTEKMSLPLVLTVLGFLIFLGYAAVARVLLGL